VLHNSAPSPRSRVHRKLRRRERVWWYRSRVPGVLAAAVGRHEVWLSLRTSRLRLARRRADAVEARLSLTFSSVRPGAREEVLRRFFMEARRWIAELVRRWASEELDSWEETWEVERALGRPVDASAVAGLDEEREAYREALEDATCGRSCTGVPRRPGGYTSSRMTTDGSSTWWPINRSTSRR
jgi:hypothetical protein